MKRNNVLNCLDAHIIRKCEEILTSVYRKLQSTLKVTNSKYRALYSCKIAELGHIFIELLVICSNQDLSINIYSLPGHHAIKN